MLRAQKYKFPMNYLCLYYIISLPEVDFACSSSMDKKQGGIINRHRLENK